MARALEHLKPAAERVVDDPWAQYFLSSAGATSARRVVRTAVTGRVLRRLGPIGTTYVPLRHRFIDEHLTAALDAGVTQVVLLGAGYDTRAYRFADQLDGRPVFEVDLAPISRAKAATIAKHEDEFPDANVVRVEIDFESQALTDVLSDAGCAVGDSTFFVWEGVPMYLTRAAVKATLDAVHELSGAGSQIAHDMWYLVDDPGPLGTARRTAPGRAEPDRRAGHVRRASGGLPGLHAAPRLPHRRSRPRLGAPGPLRARRPAPLVDDSLYVLCAERVAPTALVK